ncbi:MAG: CAP domain-containing protein [Deltaproteobacteria bacterium]|nr:CAP domain-containing protein [Deltaproteobacteria bacterium]
MKVFLIAAAVALGILPLFSGCDDSSGSVSLNEEENDVFYYTNMARTDPSGFADEFLPPGSSNGAYEDLSTRTPVPPLALSEGLILAARAHSKDMALNCGMYHDSCDGTSWSDRISSYYDGGTLGENIASGFGTGLSVVIAWIEDFNIESLGHRENILRSTYEHIGIGQYESYWTQDFGAGGI